MAATTKKPAPGQTIGADAGPSFDPAEFSEELAAVAGNRAIGTKIWFENEHVQIWDLSLQPGERVPFHTHDHTYFWTVTDAGRVMQRYDDGTSRVVDVEVGHTNFLTYEGDDCTVHDLENIGDTFFRCMTVILKDL